MKKIKIVAIMGKAGSGKDSILKVVSSKYRDSFNEIVSCTTRPPREGERDGINYHFLTPTEFAKKIIDGDMLEATEFNNWHYGTSLAALSKDKINIGVFNPAGIYCLIDNPDIELTVFYIQTTNKERLLRQLNREEDPDVEEIVRRYYADEDDFYDLEDIDYIPINNTTEADFSRAVETIGQTRLNN